VKEFRFRLRKILECMVGRVVTPSDVVTLTGLPRYEVLATFHVLEALGVVEVVNAKGNYRVYKISALGMELLKALQESEQVLLKISPSTQETLTKPASSEEATTEA